MSMPSTACFWIQRWKTGMNSSSLTDAASAAKNLTTILWRSIGRALQLQAAAVRRLDEELSFLHEAVHRVESRVRRGTLDRREEVLGELAAREGIPEELRVEELLAEFADHLRELVRDGALCPHEFPGGGRHRAERLVGRLPEVSRLERELRLEGFALRGGQAEVDRRNDLARALPDPHVAGGVFARIAPVLVVLRMGLVRRDRGQVLEQGAHLCLPDPLDPGLEALVLRPLPEEGRGHPVDDVGDVPGGDGDDPQSVGARVVVPLA